VSEPDLPIEELEGEAVLDDAEGSENGAARPSPAETNAVALEAERERARKLEEQLEAIRRSESFRIGHALVSLRRRVKFWRRPAKPRPALPPGPAPAAPAAPSRRPVEERTVLLVALDDGAARGLGEELGRLNSMFVSFVPVVLADAATIPPEESEGIVVEHVIPLDQWRLRRPAIEWGTYVAQRIRRTVDAYDVDTMVALCSPDAKDRQAQLTAMLAPIALPRMAESEANLVE
jgi:hypothetical protein